MAENPAHETVLLAEAVAALLTKPDGCYVDATYGRGGHSREILRMLSGGGSLLAIDKDPDAVSEAGRLAREDARLRVAHGSFAQCADFVKEQGWTAVDGVLADLGVSSPQLDEPERGFSFMHDGPLDMRMDTSSGESAAEWLARVEESELVRVLKEFGEERFARRIARAIVAAREAAPFHSTLQLAKVVAEANPAWEKHKHPATRTFQAIRIAVNNELGDLEALLKQSASLLKVGGRLVVISFHSLEDRMVKQFMRRLAKGDEPPPGVPVAESQISRPFKVFSKALKPSKEEVSKNVRARSAVMRVMERVS